MINIIITITTLVSNLNVGTKIGTDEWTSTTYRRVVFGTWVFGVRKTKRIAENYITSRKSILVVGTVYNKLSYNVRWSVIQTFTRCNNIYIGRFHNFLYYFAILIIRTYFATLRHFRLHVCRSSVDRFPVRHLRYRQTLWSLGFRFPRSRWFRRGSQLENDYYMTRPVRRGRRRINIIIFTNFEYGTCGGGGCCSTDDGCFTYADATAHNCITIEAPASAKHYGVDISAIKQNATRR